MRWRTGRRSDNVEDRRGEGGLGGSPFGGRRPMQVGRTVGVGGGIGGLLLVVVLMLMGVDPRLLLTGSGLGPEPAPNQTSDYGPEDPQFRAPTSGVEEELKEFVSVVLADTEDTWSALFQASGKRYVEPTLVLFSGLTRSACGLGEAAMGPFYCPGDQKVY
ncbi:MAG: neutral zinc metallopeptidase, partial [Bdellovibrio bacteriovorus]